MPATIAATPYLSPESMPMAPDAFIRIGDARTAPAAAWIVDPGLAHHRGHHHPLDAVLLAALTAHGDHARVLCHRSFPPEPGFVPCFRHSIYDAWATSPAELQTRLAAHADAFEDDLSAALRDRISPADLLLFPTAHLSLLTPLQRWLDGLPAARRPRVVRLHFHVAPTHGMDGEATCAAATGHFADALRKLVRDHAVHCTADHAQLAADLSALCGLTIATAKSPHVIPPGVQRVQRHDGRIRLLFIGEPRAEKGYVTLVHALQDILARTTRCDVRFVLPVIREADLAYLRTLPPDRVSVRLEDGLPSAAYFDEIAHADHVLCVYDRARYAAMSSGIAVDAALLDVPIVITRGTATERAVIDRSRVRVIDEPTPAALVALCVALDRESAPMASAAVTDPEGELRRGMQLEQEGRRAEAEQVYRAIVRADARHAPAWHALGLLALSAGQLAQAVEWVEQATLVDDANPVYQRNLCELCRRAGRLDKAMLAGRRACRLAPDDLGAHYNLGVAYTDAGEIARAIEAYARALEIDPDHGLSWNNLGALRERQGDRARAADAYARAIACNPRHAEAQNNLGALLRADGKWTEARACFQAALAARPDFPEARQNLAELDATAGVTPAGGAAGATTQSAEEYHLRGITLYREGRFQEALAAYDFALTLKPDAPATLNSRGFLLQDLDRMDEALSCFERAVALAPEFSMARLNLGMAQLKLGHWRAGWDNYEARWTGSAEATNGQMARPPSTLPQWDGQGDTAQQRLLVITEQGFGDTFQFARYLPLAAARFAKVGFVCSGPTQRLMEWACGDRIVLMARMPSDFGAWDWQCPLMSLPRAFRTTPETIPANVPYLSVPEVTAAHWRERLDLAAPGRLRIGIAWAGRKAHQYDGRRSLAFRQLAPLLADDRVAWVSLQKWTAEEGPPQVPADVDWIDWTEELTDFADTAALVAGLDLVLSIDSSMVHLAGALGRPVWMMNRFDAEWRWFRHRSDSPWYPSMRIFNQPAFGAWEPVIAQVREALASVPVPRPSAPRRARVPAAPTVPVPPAEGLSVDQAIQLAGQYQSAGRLAEAEGLLTQILRTQPRHAHALHLQGVVAWMSGGPERAIALICEAIAAAPDVALFHSNLAEMYRQQGRLAEAVAHGEQAVTLDPAMASAHSNLGIALCDAGEHDRAEACHRRALQLAPDLVQSLNNLGSIRRALADLGGAADWYRKALAARPDYPESLSNLGAVLVEDDRAAEAEPILERALQLQPAYPEALCNLGLARLGLGRADSAIGLLQRALQLRPGYHEAIVGLARALHDADRIDEATALVEDAVARTADRADLWWMLGLFRTELADPDRAEAAFRRALEIDPKHADALTGLGNLSLEAGRFDAAEAFLKQAIALKPEDVGARFHLTQVRKVTPDDANLAALEAMLPTAESLKTEQRISLHYALGKAWDDLKAWDRAFGHFLAGARLKRSRIEHDAAADAARTARIASIVDGAFIERLRGVGDPSDVPVFVLGMPRSGTTLTEQIIASHPEVHGAGELRDLMDIVQGPADAGARPYPDNLAGLTPAVASRWGRDYVAGLRARAPDARRITDKMPSNYFALGLIPLLLPNARIIHVQRDPVDTCVSCFTRLFNHHQEATYDLAEIGRHYVAYAKLMQHWRSVLPADSFLDVRYEDLVADTEGQARRLIAYCGLDWDDACLAFHQTKRVVRTASVAQVRQPIYSSSIERWRHYEKHLGPLLDALGEFGPAR